MLRFGSCGSGKMKSITAGASESCVTLCLSNKQGTPTRTCRQSKVAVAMLYSFLLLTLAICDKVQATLVPQACTNPNFNADLSSINEANIAVVANTAWATSNRVSACASSQSNDFVVRFIISNPGFYTIETSRPSGSSAGDTVLQVNHCSNGAVVACNDDISGGNNLYSRVIVNLSPGTYIASVNSYDSTNVAFLLTFFRGKVGIDDCDERCSPGTCVLTCTSSSISCSSLACATTLYPTASFVPSPPTPSLDPRPPTPSPKCTSTGLCQVEECLPGAASCVTSVANGVRTVCSDCPPSPEALATECRTIEAGEINQCSDINSICQSSGQGSAVFYEFTEAGGTYACTNCMKGGTIESHTDELSSGSISRFLGAWGGVTIGVAVLGLGIAIVARGSIGDALRMFYKAFSLRDRSLSYKEYLMVRHPLAICCGKTDQHDGKSLSRKLLEHVVEVWINPLALSLVFASANVGRTCSYLKQGSLTTLSQSNTMDVGIYSIDDIPLSIFTSALAIVLEGAFGVLLTAGFRSLDAGKDSPSKRGSIMVILLPVFCIMTMLGASIGLLVFAITLLAEAETDANKYIFTALIFFVSKVVDFFFFCFITNTLTYCLFGYASAGQGQQHVGDTEFKSGPPNSNAPVGGTELKSDPPIGHAPVVWVQT